jgi:YVTN family beta-propeller protein
MASQPLSIYSKQNRNATSLQRRTFVIAVAVCSTILLPFWRSVAERARESVPSTGLISRRAIVFNAAANKVYAVDPENNAVSIISGDAHSLRSVKVGDGPLAIAVNPTTDRVYVANTNGGTVSVLDGTSDAVLATVNVGARPYVLAVNPIENKVYVSNTFSDVLTIIDGKTNTISRVKTGSADAINVDPKRNRVYLLGYESSSLTVLDGADSSLSKLPAGAMHLWSMVMDEASATLYVTRIGNADVVAIDTHTHALTPVGTGQLPCAIAANEKTRLLYVANCGDDSVSVIDETKRVTAKTIHVGSHPQAIAVDAKNNLIYVANTHGNSMTVIDGSRNEVVATLPAGTNPYAVALDASTGAIFVANLGEPSFTRIDRPRVSNKSSPYEATPVESSKLPFEQAVLHSR